MEIGICMIKIKQNLSVSFEMKYFLLFLIILKCIFGEYSSIDFHEDLVKDSGNYWISINNLCFSRASSEIVGNIFIFYPNHSFISKFTNYIKMFYFNYGIINDNSLIDFRNEEIWLTSSHINMNICHFLDNMFLYNIENDNKYPPINHLIMADFNPQSTLPYNNMMLKMMINNYKNRFKISFQSEISKLLRKSKNHLLCYKRVHLFIRSENGGWLGIFHNYLIGRKFRDEGYKYLKMEMKYNNEKSITIINRKIEGRSRSILNLKMMKEMIKCMGYNYNEIYFEDKNPKEQIKSIMNSKIIISPHGSGLTNMIWLISLKSLIIECISTYYTFAYERLSSVLNYRLIPLFSIFHNINPNTFDDGYDEKYKFDNKPNIFQSVYYGFLSPLFNTHGNNIIISLKQIEFSIKYGLNYLNNI